ncbi:MAG: DUF3365 domain-containing protein [Opitutae bacterium]|nr:DUF3365 domain-containing protein [Opitutae bacterium]
MKARLTPLAAVIAGGVFTALASAAEAPAAPSMKFSWVENPDATQVGIRTLGERTIDRIGSALIMEVERVLTTQGLDTAVEELHLKNLKLPRPVDGKPRVVAMKRTSLRIRNPDNAPDAADMAALKLVAESLGGDEPPPKVLFQKVETPDAPVEWRVYRPIAVTEHCLLCHGKGDSLQPSVQSAVARHFPEDQAVNYSAYDWRGLIRVSITEPMSRAN